MNTFFILNYLYFPSFLFFIIFIEVLPCAIPLTLGARDTGINKLHTVCALLHKSIFNAIQSLRVVFPI